MRAGAQVEVSKTARCNKCGAEDVAWVQSNRSGKWYLARCFNDNGALVAAIFMPHFKECKPNPQVEAQAQAEAHAATATLATLDPGVYMKDGEVFKVQQNKEKTKVYAKRLIPINGSRLSENDDRVKWEFEYAPGAIYNLTAEDRMSQDDADQFGLRYGICACCSRTLKAEKSVLQGIGPVCIKWFKF